MKEDDLLQKTIYLVVGLILFNATLLNISYSQDIVDDINTPIELGDSGEIFTETIRIISRSKRIFIITNTNQMLNKGDFITILLQQKGPVARCLVGKTYKGKAGIKIMKIYSLKRWGMLQKGLDIQIVKGDDSFLFKKNEKKEGKNKDEPKINNEEDLYSDHVIDEDLNMFGKDNRLIKPDNIVSVAYSRYSVDNTISGDNEVYNEFSGSWSYQFIDNMWVEGLYGRILMSGVPAQGTETLINNFTARLKYTFKAPLYSYFMPYIGYQSQQVSSPDAGNVNNTAQADAEVAFVNSLKKNRLIAGVTVLRRLVPGWFLKADLGIDEVNIGFAIEF